MRFPEVNPPPSLPFGGGSALPVAKSDPMAFSLNEGQTTPWNLAWFQHMEEWIWGAVTHRHPAWTPLVAWTDFPWICEFLSRISSPWSSKGQQFRNVALWVSYLWVLRVFLVSQLQEFYGDLNKQRLFVCAHCGSTEREKKKMGDTSGKGREKWATGIELPVHRWPRRHGQWISWLLGIG